jgi:ribose/xylose/arabinose/galactoside ABC-type transport system permease subunit
MTGLAQLDSSARRAFRITPNRSIRVWLTQPTSKTLVINVGVLFGLFIWFSFATSGFMSVENQTNLIRQVSFVGIAACAVTPVMVAGGLDLSVGATVAISGVTAALFVAHLGWPLWLSFLLGALAGAVVGTLNAFLVVVMRINPVIATLGTLYVGRGLANVLAGGSPVTGVPLAFDNLATAFVAHIPVPVLVFGVFAAIMIVIERKTLLGRWVVASGGNQEAARLAGIPVNRTRAIFYVLSGLAAGVTGILINSRIATGDPNSGLGFEFSVIVAVVLGGTAITGGQGTIIGSIIGVLIIGSLDNGLNLMGVNSFYQEIVLGIALIFAVGLGELLRGTWRSVSMMSVPLRAIRKPGH